MAEVDLETTGAQVDPAAEKRKIETIGGQQMEIVRALIKCFYVWDQLGSTGQVGGGDDYLKKNNVTWNGKKMKEYLNKIYGENLWKQSEE